MSWMCLETLVAMLVVATDQSYSLYTLSNSSPASNCGSYQPVTTGGKPNINLWEPLKPGTRGIYK